MMTPSTQRVPDFDIPETLPAASLGDAERAEKVARISSLLREHDAKLIAHYYTDPDIQRLAEASDGFIGDSLAMARFGCETPATTLIVAGVQFMGESAKILSPEKRILMPTLKATCSLDLGCPIEVFAPFCDAHPDRSVVVYCNTSAAVKARADWVVTSSNALDIVDHLDAQGKKILFGPDRHLGAYIQKQTGADMLLWQGACVVHEEFQSQALISLKKEYSQAVVLAHPESPQEVLALADVVGSTTQLLQATQRMSQETFIVATDRGLFYKMQQAEPNKTFIEAPTAGFGATCRSCGHCPWMAMNGLDNLERSLISGANEIILAPQMIEKAKMPLQRMVDFKR